MSSSDNSILLIGESDVGKTHYGAQLLKRLMKRDGQLRMNGAATNIEPFESAMSCLDEGMAAGHTATSTYVDSIWPIMDAQGRSAKLIWPDYGGEQIKAISDTRRIPAAWQSRVVSAPAWLLLIRLQKTRVTADIFSRPLHAQPLTSTEGHEIQISDQARLIELLQILLYIRGMASTKPLVSPRLCVLLSCWDELSVEDAPPELLKSRLPLLSSFIHNTWAKPNILGLSALGQALSPRDPNDEYSNRGPEQFGYVVLPDGQHSSDLTLPIQYLLDENL
ncbi:MULTISPECIES: TRAFAC clade GTPase domain-containing protein [Aeromonas]|uniref:TRAFAC clade GTPase domain-containing protein n=1 Tax=Aeromonas TaxID=642 RepID=UPI0021E8DE53|nr:hypothetical protein [Aeromonas veronii]MCV3282907.1 hypothetical protein [Aeromonas veronii]